MNSRKRKLLVVVILCIAALLIAGIVLTNTDAAKSESLQETMQDAVLHETGKISLFGLKDVNPSLLSGFIVTGVLLVAAALIRLFAVPKFKYKPGRLQMLLEGAVGFFDNIAVTNSPQHHGFLGAYIFGAGVYIFFGTLFELFGIQAVTTAGHSISLPAPLSDINAALSLGCLSYLIILGGGIFYNGLRGLGRTLKDFSLPLSMSFRMFGALLSGLLVSELVYYSLSLSFVLPVIVAVLFTLLHALIQTYVLAMLTALFFGEATERHEEATSAVKEAKS